MLTLDFLKKETGPLRILCLGAHCDDIEIGCGGTLLELTKRYTNAYIYWVVFASNPVREQEATTCANAFLSAIENRKIVIKQFRESFFPYIADDIKAYFEQIKSDFTPDLIFTHYRDDRHQDHRTISDLTWNTFRNHLILEYEILKYDGDVGIPNTFFSLSRSTCNRKIDLVHESFVSQRDKTWFDREAFMALLRIRGVECNAEEGFAEAFYSRKLVL